MIRQFLSEAAKPDFRWMWRHRIRLTMLKPGITESVSTSPSSSSIRQQKSQDNGEVKTEKGAENEDQTGEEDADTEDAHQQSQRKSKFRFLVEKKIKSQFLQFG